MINDNYDSSEMNARFYFKKKCMEDFHNDYYTQVKSKIRNIRNKTTCTEYLP